jgi:heat shock protein HtpX
MGYFIGGETGVLIAFVFSLALNFWSYYNSESFALKAHSAQPLNRNQFPEVYQIVQELANDYKIPMPKLWYIPTDIANAFATGRNPQHSSVAVTQGILEILNPRELRGVLAHELGHIKNRDILVSSLAVTLASAIGMLGNSIRFSSYSQGPDSQGDGGRGGLGVILAAIFIPIAASLIHLGISRTREYLADSSGAHTCKDPLALASALKKLEQSVKRAQAAPANAAQATTGSLFIVYPFTAKTVMNLFSTHPPMEERIARLEQMAKEKL